MALPNPIPGWDYLSAAELTGDVQNAIRRLKELGRGPDSMLTISVALSLGSQMRNQSHQFSIKDLESIDELAKHLKELVRSFS